MKSFFIKWAVNSAALFLVIPVVAGVSADSWQSIVAAALILGLLNASVKPFLLLLTLPLTIFTMGLFSLVINALMFMIASKFVRGFEVIDFASAFRAALLFSIISSVISFLLTPKMNFRFTSFKSGKHNTPTRIGGTKDDVIDVEGRVEK